MTLTLHIIGSILLIMLPLIMIAVLLEHEWPHSGSWRDRFATLTRICLSCTATAIGLRFIPRQHKRKVHLAILSIIGWDMIHAGFKIADLGYMMLSLLMEAEETVSDKPSGRVQQIHFSALIESLRDTYTIPNADLHLAQLKTWIQSQGVKIVGWHAAQAMTDAHELTEPGTYGITYRPYSDLRQVTIAVRDGFSPSLQLFFYIHEAGHAIRSRVTDDLLSFGSLSVEDTGIPCWTSEDILRREGIDRTITIASELETSLTSVEIFRTMGWDTIIPDHYLQNWLHNGRITDPPVCLRTHAHVQASPMIAVLKGTDHVAIL